MVFAFCFNDPQSAQTLAQKIVIGSTEIHFVFNDGFDQFLKELAIHPKIDAFIIEENFIECSSYDFIKKIKNSKKYKRSMTVLIVDELSKVNPCALEIGADLVIDRYCFNTGIGERFKKTIEKRQKTVIPTNYNVLVLDNQPDVLELISMHLGQMEHARFDLCLSLAEARIKLAEKRYDMLLLDWNLDDGTCLDLLEFNKKDTKAKQLKNDSALTIVITGRDDVDDIMTLLRYGVKDHIIKPFDFNEFEDKITYALEKYIPKAS